MSYVQVEAVPETFVVEVRVTHPDPKEAALWANTLGDLYVDYSIEGQVEAARRAYRWVTERLTETQEDMQKAQDKLLKSYQGQDLFVPEGSVSAITTSITKLNEDFVQTQGRKITLQSELQEFAGMRARGRDLDAVPQVASDATVLDLNGKLQGLSLELLRLKEKYKEAHPEVQKVQVQIDLLRKARATRIRQIEDGLRAEYRQLERREAELQDAIDAQKNQAVAQSQKLTELDSLKKQADSATGLYTVLLQKLNETNIAASLQNNNVRLLDRAIVPAKPGLAGAEQGGPGGAPARPGAGLRLRAPPRLLRQRDQGRRGRRALPAHRAPGRGPQADEGQRAPGHRGLPDPAHGPPLRAEGRPRPDPARLRHRPRRRQDHHGREPGPPARGVGRDHGGGRLRPPARQPPQPPGGGAGARPHGLLREADGRRRPRPAHQGQEPLRAHRRAAAPEPARHPGPRQRGRCSWRSSAAITAG